MNSTKADNAKKANTIIANEKLTLIPIGKQGENKAVSVLFSVNGWRDEFGKNGTFNLIHRRFGDELPYPIEIEFTDDGVLWNISDTDNAVAGYGECELRYSVGDVIKKSVTWRTKTIKALAPEGETPPDPFESWYENILDAGNIAQGYSEDAADSAGDAESAAEAAATSASSAGAYESSAQGYAEDAAQSAAEAKTAAETSKAARTSAVSAANSAEAAKNDILAIVPAVYASAEDASLSATAAANSAAEANSAANSASYYAQNATNAARSAQTYSNGAGVSASAAESAKNAALDAKDAAAQSASDAATSARNASLSETAAAESERQAEASKEAIENMGALAQTTAPGSAATVTKTVAPDGTVTLEFGIPRGDKGDQGDDYELTYNDKVEIASIVPGIVIVNVSGTTPVIVGEDNHRYICGEVTTIDITPPTSGMCDVIFTSGSTAAVLTLTGTTMPEWFDSTALEADKTYELNFMDSYGTVALW